MTATAHQPDIIETGYTLRVVDSQRPLVEVALNGYNIASAGVAVRSRMRSFKLTRGAPGDLRPYWRDMTTLELVDVHGRGQSIQIAALPTDEAGYGLLAFLGE